MKKNYFLTILMIALITQINAQTWTSLSMPTTTGVAGLAVANNKLFLAGSNGIFTSSDAINWDTAITGMTVFAGFTFNANVYNYNNIMYSGAGLGTIYKSVDFGANWTTITGAGPSTSAENTTIFVKGDTIIGGWKGNKGIRSSFDGGTTWTSTSGFNQTIANSIVYLNGNIFIKTLTGVYKSTDMAATFTKLNGGLPTFSGSVGALTESNGVLICTIYLVGTFISSDAGATWSEVSTAEGLTTTAGKSFFVDGGIVYFGCAGGKVFKSTNNGSTWTDFSGTGLNSLEHINHFAIFNGKLYAGGTYALYETPISTSTDNKILEKDSYSVYPNPTNEQLSISFDLKNSVVNYISITDLSGKIVKQEIVQANQQHITISTNDLENGIYLLYTDNTLLSPKKIVVSH